MKLIGKVLLTAALFLVFLIWRFPYDTLVERSVRILQTGTGAHIRYTPVSAGPLGVKVRDLKLQLPSGAKFQCNSARFFPTRNGIRAQLYQENGEAFAVVTPRNLSVELNNLEVQTGNEELGLARLTGDLQFQLQERVGKGKLRLVAPEFSAPLPNVDPPLEVGSTFNIKNLGTPEQPRSQIAAQVKLVNESNTFTADGPLQLETPAGGGSPLISGNLRFDHPISRGTLRLGGRWNDLKTEVIPQ